METADEEGTFAQTWHDNMGRASSPEVRANMRKSGYTRVSFVPDYVRLGVTDIRTPRPSDTCARLCGTCTPSRTLG